MALTEEGEEEGGGKVSEKKAATQNPLARKKDFVKELHRKREDLFRLFAPFFSSPEILFLSPPPPSP